MDKRMVSLFLFLIPLVIFIFFIYKWYKSTLFVCQKSTVDNNIYKVKPNYSLDRANALARINKGVLNVIDYIQKLPNKPNYAGRLSNFNPRKIEDNILDDDITFTIDKGKQMVFCLTDRVGGAKVYDHNLLMYVSLHELAHIASISVGHTLEFKQIFKSILSHAVLAKEYVYNDYSVNNVNYCGINLTSNILG